MREILVRTTRDMVHRGPDGVGTCIGEGIGLGMTRLAIVGGEEGKQPIWNEDESVAVVCNGEIYNHIRLRTALEESGHSFSTLSDVEVIVHLYEEYQEQCLDCLEGIFAFAVWDARRRKLFVARDRCGVKPLYYSQTDQGWMFCSEFQALLNQIQARAVDSAVDGGVDRVGDRGVKRGLDGSITTALDEQALAAYHSFRFVPAPGTIAKGIYKLRPGEYITIEPDVVRKEVYWRAIPMEKTESGSKSRSGLSSQSYSSFSLQSRSVFRPAKPFRHHAVELKHRMLEALLSQATSEVKTGILLSGGLDSSSLLAMHHKLFDAVPQTFTVGFTSPKANVDAREYCELKEAARVAKVFHAEHVTELVTPKQVLDVLPRIIAALDEPIADPTAIPLWFAVQLAKQSGVKVLFSGEGMDELFAGYSVYRQVHWLRALNFAPVALRKSALRLTRRLGLPGRGVLSRSLLPASEWYQGVGGAFSDSEIGRLYRGDRSQVSPQDVVREAMRGLERNSVLSQMTYFDMQAWLAEDTLVKSDKISMAHSVELRVPFLHECLVEMALGLPDALKLSKGMDKRIVREAMKGIVPDFVLRRKKNGFPIPLTAWIFGEWKEFAWTTLRDSSAHVRNLYKLEEIDGLFQSVDIPYRLDGQVLGHSQGRIGSHAGRRARLIWTLLSLELWHKYVLNGNATAHASSSIQSFGVEDKKSIRQAAP